MDKKLSDALEIIKEYDEHMCFNRFMYDKQIDLHIWTIYNINTFKGFEVHYNASKDEWTYYLWKRESPFIQDLVAGRSYIIKETEHEEIDIHDCCSGGAHDCDDCKCSSHPSTS